MHFSIHAKKNELCTGEITKGQGATSLSWATIAKWHIPHFFWGGGHIFFLKIEPLIKNKYFQRFPPIYSYVKFAFLTSPPPTTLYTPYPWGSRFGQTWIYNIWRCFHRGFKFSGKMVFEKILKTLTLQFLCKNLNPHWLVPPYIQGSWFEQIWIRWAKNLKQVKYLIWL